MVGELAIWLMVIAVDPDHHSHKIEDKEEATIEECMADQAEWLKRGMKVKRGDWILSVRCDLEHSEGDPASLKEEVPEE